MKPQGERFFQSSASVEIQVPVPDLLQARAPCQCRHNPFKRSVPQTSLRPNPYHGSACGELPLSLLLSLSPSL